MFKVGILYIDMATQKIEDKIKMYADLAAKDKSIDVASLMLAEIENHEANMIPMKQKRWAYLISLAVPPLGLLYAGKFYLDNKDDSKETAIMCVILTIASLLIFWIMVRSLLGGTSVQQIEQINPQDVQQLLQ